MQQILQGSTLDEKYSNLIIRCALGMRACAPHASVSELPCNRLRFTERKRRRAAWADVTLWMHLRRRGLHGHILKRIRSLVFAAERRSTDGHEPKTKYS